MASTLSTPMMLALAGVVGILLGLLVSTLVRGEPKSNPEENPLPQKFIDKGYAEAARLFFSPAEKRSLTQLDGDFYPDFSALTPEQKKRVLRILQSWQEWAGSQVNPAAGSQVNPAAGSQMSPAAGSQATQAAFTRTATAAEGRTVVIPPLPKERELSTSAELNQSVTAVKPAAPAAKPAKPLTIVEQINDILTEVVANSPESKRGIRLMDDGHQGVLVWVGLEKFNGVDQVPYPEVQQLIRTAVARWEELSTGQIK
jgi:hypothetical protein